MIHMMNANTFTGAAYHLTGDVSADEFADASRRESWRSSGSAVCRIP